MNHSWSFHTPRALVRLRLTHKLVFLTVFARALADWLMRIGARPGEGRDEGPKLGVVVGIRGPGMGKVW